MKGKKIVSTLLALLLLASLPVSAHAATWDIGKGDITVNAESGGQTVRQGGGAAIPDSAPVITGTSKENNVTINADSGQTASVTLSGVNIDVRDKGKAAVSTTGEGNVSIELNGGSTLRSGYEHAGLEKNNGGSLTIGDENKDGKLTGGDTKLGLVSDDIIPNKVCLVPDLLKTLPYKPFAASAIDALIHATESFLSPHRKTVTSEMFSVKAMEMILEGFRRIALEGPDARMDYLGEFVHASLFAGIAFLKAGCATVHGMSFPLGGTYHVPHGESNYALFGKILEMYDEYEPAGELGKFKEIVARCLGCTKEDALRTLNVTLEKVLHLKPLHEYGFKEEDVKAFALSVDANQQRLITNSYRPWSIELSERVYKECF